MVNIMRHRIKQIMNMSIRLAGIVSTIKGKKDILNINL